MTFNDKTLSTQHVAMYILKYVFFCLLIFDDNFHSDNFLNISAYSSGFINTLSTEMFGSKIAMNMPLNFAAYSSGFINTISTLSCTPLSNMRSPPHDTICFRFASHSVLVRASNMPAQRVLFNRVPKVPSRQGTSK